MDSVIHHVTTLPAMKSLLSVTHHDYLPNEYDAVVLEPDVYFQLNELKVVDGHLDTIKFVIFCFDHDVQHLQEFVDNCNTAYERRMANKLGIHRYFFDQMVQSKAKGVQNPLPSTHLVYTKSKFVTNRTFGNVFFDQKKQVQHRTKFFLENRNWYDRKGIPYTLGFLYHGQPGTGKTLQSRPLPMKANATSSTFSCRKSRASSSCSTCSSTTRFMCITAPVSAIHYSRIGAALCH
jgi:AAA+ superfamily predicted ATPase